MIYLEETLWIGRESEYASNSNNWNNGLPNSEKKAIIPKDAPHCQWDISDLTIPIFLECDDCNVSISDVCYFRGECYAPKNLNLYVDNLSLDKPPPDNLYIQVVQPLPLTAKGKIELMELITDLPPQKESSYSVRLELRKGE